MEKDGRALSPPVICLLIERGVFTPAEEKNLTVVVCTVAARQRRKEMEPPPSHIYHVLLSSGTLLKYHYSFFKCAVFRGTFKCEPSTSDRHKI